MWLIYVLGGANENYSKLCSSSREKSDSIEGDSFLRHIQYSSLSLTEKDSGSLPARHHHVLSEDLQGSSRQATPGSSKHYQEGSPDKRQYVPRSPEQQSFDLDTSSSSDNCQTSQVGKMILLDVLLNKILAGIIISWRSWRLQIVSRKQNIRRRRWHQLGHQWPWYTSQDWPICKCLQDRVSWSFSPSLIRLKVSLIVLDYVLVSPNYLY